MSLLRVSVSTYLCHFSVFFFFVNYIEQFFCECEQVPRCIYFSVCTCVTVRAAVHVQTFLGTVLLSHGTNMFPSVLSWWEMLRIIR